MTRQTTIHSAIFALFAALMMLLIVFAIALSTHAQEAVPPCPRINDVTLVSDAYTATKTKCVYAGPWDVFMGWPGYSPYFFCSRNTPDGMIVYKAVETFAGDVKCVWIFGSEQPEYRLSSFRGFN